MTPSMDDRIASVVRALKDVILPHLPDGAPLAQEQAQLAIGHLEILRAQLDAAPQFEREECADAVTLAQALLEATGQERSASGDSEDDAVRGARAELSGVLQNTDALAPRDLRNAINRAVGELLAAVANVGGQRYAASTALILEHEQRRIQKDRIWNAPFGFDTI